MVRNKNKDNKTVDRRLIIILALFLIFISVLFSRMFSLQFLNHEHYLEISKSNILKESFLIPKRGVIVDRKNRVIADNRPMFYAIVVPEEIVGFKVDKKIATQTFINRVSEFIELDGREKDKLLVDILKSPVFREVVIKTDLSQDELSGSTSNIKYLKGLNINSAFVRQYPHNELFLSVLGYVGKANQKDFDTYEGTLINLDYIGKTGLESVYQKELHGIHGKEITAINAGGRVINREVKYSPVDGRKLTTTLDLDLQKLASDMLLNEKGAVVAMNPNNGDVLAFVSMPSYDANKFIKGISQTEYDKYFKDDSPLFNRVLMGQYPPASTYKPFIALAALEGSFIKANDKVWCGPYYSIPGSKRRFLDWKTYGHGNVDLVESIEVSADVYYYKLGLAMGVDYTHDVMKHFGFGKKTGISLYNEKSGLLPSSKWKNETKKEAWWKGESVINAIGQGYTTVTPLQLAVATSTLVNGGTRYKPRLTNVDDIEVVETVNFNKEYIDVVKLGMKEVMHGKKGTGRTYVQGKNKLDFIMGGKTGTAQVYSTHGVKDKKAMKEKPKHLQDHALFIGFAPFDKPEIVVAVIVENGMHGSSSATPIAVEIMRKYLEKDVVDSLENKEPL